MDLTTLDRLHDIVQPSPVSWWPPAAGWFGLGGVFLVIAVVISGKRFVHYRRDAYRREALDLWSQLPAGTSGTELVASVSELLKRTALAVYPRQQVAALTGETWLRFLNETTRYPCFTGPLEQIVSSGPYAGDDINLPPSAQKALLEAARKWILGHDPRRGVN